MNVPIHEFLEVIRNPLASPAPTETGRSFIDLVQLFPVPRSMISLVWPPNHRLEITIGSIQEAVIVKVDDRTLPTYFVFGLPQFPGAGCLEGFSFNEHSINFYCERLPTCTFMFYYGNPYFDLLLGLLNFFQKDFQPVSEGIAKTVNSLYIVGWSPKSEAFNQKLLLRPFDRIVFIDGNTSSNGLTDMLTMVNTESLALCCNPEMSFVFPKLTVTWFEVRDEVKDCIPWFAYHHLNSLDCAIIIIWRSVLTNYDLMDLLVNWSLGRFEKLSLFASLQKKENGDTLDYCEKLIWPYPRGKGFRRPACVLQDMGLTSVLPDSEGVDIQRYDGTWGTFFVKGTKEGSTSRNFYFIVWTDFEHDA